MRLYARLYVGLTCLLSAVLPFPFRARAGGGESQVKGDEQILFFPTAATWDGEQRSWSIPIHGWVFEPEADGIARGMAVRRLRSSFGLDPAQPATRLFDERIRWFLVDNERGKVIAIRLAGNEFTLEESAADGHFFGTISLPESTVGKHMEQRRIRYEAVLGPADNRSFSGVVHFPSPQGVSIISDIDDTIKVSNVRDRKQLLQNTFFRPFHAVSGMPEKYRQWAQEGAEFHFVSASPWQLYDPLTAFFQQEGFPPATIHLKRVRFKDASVLKLFEDPVAYKQELLEGLLNSFPQRTFVLVGDSGEKDPEVYGMVARRYPQQVVKIYIRDVTGDAADSERYQSAFRDLPSVQWTLFRDANTLELPGSK